MWWSPSPSIPYRLLSTVPGWENPLLSQREHHQPVSALDAGVPPGRMGLGLQMDTAGSLPAAPTMRRTSHVRRGAGGHHTSPGITLSPIKKCPPMAASASFSFFLGSLLKNNTPKSPTPVYPSQGQAPHHPHPLSPHSSSLQAGKMPLVCVGHPPAAAPGVVAIPTPNPHHFWGLPSACPGCWGGLFSSPSQEESWQLDLALILIP